MSKSLPTKSETKRLERAVNVWSLATVNEGERADRAEARVRDLEAVLERFADRDNWAAQKRVAACGCRFIEWCDHDEDPYPWDLANAALGREGEE